MRALSKTPNDPLLQSMTPAQWKFSILNVIEDEKELNKKIHDLVDIGVRIFCGSPKEESKDGSPITQFVGKEGEPTMDKPDIAYTVNAGGQDMTVRKVLSTEFDKVLESGGEYQGYKVEPVGEETRN